MFCPKCGKEVKEGSKYCKYCGFSLNVHESSKENKSNSRNIIIVTLIIIILIILITGFLIISHNESLNQNTVPLNILGGSFSTGNASEDLTFAKIYVGSQHASEKVYVSTIWSRNGNNLNNGTKWFVTVDSKGYINYNSEIAFKYYPDKAVVSLYFANGTLSESKIIHLSPTYGTQTF